MTRRLIIVLTLIAALGLGLALYTGQTSQSFEAAVAFAQEMGTPEIPFLGDWEESAHADAESESFVHWDEDGEVPTSCAKCHSTPGFLDFVGIDGTAAGAVDNAAPIGTVITCMACHNDATVEMTSVVMPSGLELVDLGPEARCMQCHQGRQSTVSVNEAIEEAGASDEDTVSEELGFANIHYYAAAATKYGTLAKGGYEYEGKTYDANFAHVEEFDSCNECHDSHTLELQLEACTDCHPGAASVEDVQAIRMQGSLVDYDGDGDTEEGIAAEITGLQEMLYQAIQAYGNEVAGTAIAYNAESHPYFFIDTNGDGEAGEDESARDNAYNAWTPRLVKAAYNYQTSLKDPGAYAHGGKYIIQLLYDSIEDLNSALSSPVDLSNAHRIDDGHFAGSEEAFRHWDGEEDGGIVPADCVKCHAAEGLPLYLEEGTTISLEASNGFQCSTCHDDLETYTYYEVAEVEFPSGAMVGSENMATNLCINCHQGRTSTVTVNEAIEGLEKDTVSEDLGFLNIHYFAAGATLFGTEVQGAYEYEGQEYEGRFMHAPNFTECSDCHSVHGLDVKVEGCSGCHPGTETEEDLMAIRSPMAADDYDGDGDTEEGAAGEIETMREALYAALQDYATNVVGTDLVYDSHSYPYYFVDTNGNGEPDEEEAAYSNQYNAWTPRLLQAAYNYQYVTKDPGAFAHNSRYIMQVLYDSLEDIGEQATVDMADMVRPE